MSKREPGTITLVPLTEDELWTRGEPVKITSSDQVRVGDELRDAGTVAIVKAIVGDSCAFTSSETRHTCLHVTNCRLFIGHTLLARLDENGVSQPVTRSRRRKTWRELYEAGAMYWQAPGQDLPKPIAGLCYEDVSPTGKYTFYRVIRH